MTTPPKVALITGVTGQDGAYLSELLLNKANNFRRSDNKLAYAYLLTPRIASAKVRLAHAFLARKEHEFERLHREIAALRSELKIERLDT